MTQTSTDFSLWYEALQRLSKQWGLQDLVSSDPRAHLASYSKGFSPEEELVELEELTQWNGCACGG